MGEAVCPSCGLKHGVRVDLRSPTELEADLEQGLVALRSLLTEPEVIEYLGRQSSEWLRWDGAGESLFAMVNEVNLAQLEAALRPRRRVQRKWTDLELEFDACQSRRDFEVRFSTWLDGGENLAADDYVSVVR